ncbi:conditioned medium-induced protein 4 [Halobacterium sp. R2-5]|uniref:conditioned medium-induced protein 4 n=1 Tax=Halobacterium sp. R2-5 TaxID=2715751 RepID=UPI00141DDAED|nr:conditioned medium-induced protein 4 [Halobacterium sp. R2-5]NIB98071.1 conditioned medium-induced protein 4 [Halobacterium sp. R2-5]
MDEKTEELRDIFVDVADDDTVTESQEDTHGSLASEADVEARLRETVAAMRKNLDFETSLSVDELTELVERFYGEDSDAEIADELGADAATVTEARFDLHLLREDDTDVPVDLDQVRESDADADALADELDADEDAVRRAQRVVETQAELRRVNDRYRAEFENALQDRELSERLTSSVHEDGLDGATEGQETDIDI